MTQELIIGFVGLAATTGGAAWAGVKLSMNGMKASIGRVENKLDVIEDQAQDNRVAIESIKTRCAALHPGQ